MKKQIIVGAVFMAISLTTLHAQDSVAVNARISQKFNELYPEATYARWSVLRNQAASVTFRRSSTGCLAIFDRSGNLIASGRRLRSVNDLPLQAQSGLHVQQKHAERKLGALTLAHIYEMLKGEATTYYVTMENAVASIVISLSPGGNGRIESKKIKPSMPQIAPENPIAKKN